MRRTSHRWRHIVATGEYGTNRTLTCEASGQVATDERSPIDDWSYTSDKAGRMSAAILNGVTQASFAYDADELRIVNANPLTAPRGGFCRSSV